jgi:hypothetical protein
MLLVFVKQCFVSGLISCLGCVVYRVLFVQFSEGVSGAEELPLCH